MGLCCVQGRKIISGQTCRLASYIFQLTKYFTRIFYRPEHIFPDLSYTVSQYFMNLAMMAVRKEVTNFESFVVVQELEFAMNLALYVFFLNLGSQYIVGSLSWRSLTSTANLIGISFDLL